MQLLKLITQAMICAGKKILEVKGTQRGSKNKLRKRGNLGPMVTPSSHYSLKMLELH